MIRFSHKGDFSKSARYFKRVREAIYLGIFDRFGREGVAALSSATPVDSGNTANSWYYEIENNRGSVSIIWKNSNVVNGVPIAIILQYGHGTNGGGYVRGIDYINPTIRPIFDKIVNAAWKEVTKA